MNKFYTSFTRVRYAANKKNKKLTNHLITDGG